MIRILSRALIVWGLLAVLAVANGTVRNFFWSPWLGESIGHLLSTLLLCAVILAVAWITIRWMGPRRPREALSIGITWVLATVSFEFVAGHYVFGHPWERLLADYNLAGGRVWILVVLITLLAPGWAWRARVANLEDG